jgi:cell division septal protein FtsQ
MQNIKFRRKLYINLFLLILLTSYNNQNVQIKNFFKIDKIRIINEGHLLDNSFISKLKLNLNFLIGNNIFLFDKIYVSKILNAEEFIDKYELIVNYPDSITLKIAQAYPIAFIESKNQYFGNNYKILNLDQENLKFEFNNLPIIYGSPTPKDFENLINDINLSKIKYQDITYFNFHNSKRWDIGLNNKIKIKLPFLNIVNSLDIADKIIKKNGLLIQSTIDLTIDGQIIIS